MTNGFTKGHYQWILAGYVTDDSLETKEQEKGEKMLGWIFTRKEIHVIATA